MDSSLWDSFLAARLAAIFEHGKSALSFLFSGRLAGSPRPLPPICVSIHTHLSSLQMSSPSSPLMTVDLRTLVPLPTLKTACGHGIGMAACPALGLLVTSCSENTLRVFAMPSARPPAACSSAGPGLTRVCTLGGASSPAPMRFQFEQPELCWSGWMAFTGPATSRLLLLTDAGHDAVHVIDVVGRVHMGYVAEPGTIGGPRGVAARGSLVAVSAWGRRYSGEHVVRVFEGSGAMWAAVRVVAGGFGDPGSADGQLQCPYGLRFSGDGMVAVTDSDRVCLFRVCDGAFVRHVTPGLVAPWDVEECEGGWLVACSGIFGWDTIEFVGGAAGLVSLESEFSGPSALALVPCLGLVVRDLAHVQFFATPDTIAMASMSPCRVAWMVAVSRGLLRRRSTVTASPLQSRAADRPKRRRTKAV